jgi:preprotein translocase subunit SecA
MTKLGMEENEGLQHPWLNRSVETAQKRVEQRNYQIRKHTLQYDDVMNQQRTVIYGWRTEILTTEDPRKEVFETVDEKIGAEVEVRAGTDPVDLDGLVHWANTAMPLGLRPEELQNAGGKDGWKELLKKRVREAYELKVKFESPEAVKALERYVLLGAIDRLWQEHLYAMDGLRTSINLRAYGQKDPLIEYKNEAYGMFEELMGRIKGEVVLNLFRSASSLSAFEHFLAALPQRTGRGELPVQAQAQPTEGSISMGGGQGASTAVEEALAPMKRQGPKLGRNDPCPLDGGKKFKNCCGASGSKVCFKVVA